MTETACVCVLKEKKSEWVRGGGGGVVFFEFSQHITSFSSFVARILEFAMRSYSLVARGTARCLHKVDSTSAY